MKDYRIKNCKILHSCVPFPRLRFDLLPSKGNQLGFAQPPTDPQNLATIRYAISEWSHEMVMDKDEAIISFDPPHSGDMAELILRLRPVSERRRYKVTPSLIGLAQTWNQPCMILFPKHTLLVI